MNGRFFSYLNTAASLLSQYGGEEPFHLYLKNYFRQHGKHGSRDRKTISQLCYAHLRMGRALNQAPLLDQILAALYLCSEDVHEMVMAMRPEWTAEKPEEKIGLLHNFGITLDPQQWFPLQDELSPDILQVRRDFIISHLVQPRLFLRMRPGHEAVVEQKLRRAGIPHNIAGNTIELANGVNLDGVVQTDREVVVQDMSSQKTGAHIMDALRGIGHGCRFWDCCAASGGKSLMAFDADPAIKLTVSDVRASILHNLKQRFNIAGIRNYTAFEWDLTRKQYAERFDVVLADVPCSGSGTWGRTPEMLTSFTSAMLDRYVETQRSVIDHASMSVRPGGQLIYITCSVYRRENEGMIDYLLQKQGWELKKAELIQGWMHGADTLFAASLSRW